jgi:hypothetical protein
VTCASPGASESYEVEIGNVADTTTLRTITGLCSPLVSYTAAQQSTDFGPTQTSLNARAPSQACR